MNEIHKKVYDKLWFVFFDDLEFILGKKINTVTKGFLHHNLNNKTEFDLIDEELTTKLKYERNRKYL